MTHEFTQGETKFRESRNLCTKGYKQELIYAVMRLKMYLSFSFYVLLYKISAASFLISSADLELNSNSEATELITSLT